MKKLVVLILCAFLVGCVSSPVTGRVINLKYEPEKTEIKMVYHMDGTIGTSISTTPEKWIVVLFTENGEVSCNVDQSTLQSAQLNRTVTLVCR